MSLTDLTFLELVNRVYASLRTVSTSAAYPLASIKSYINDAYSYVFNRNNIYMREASAEFVTVPDIFLTVAAVVGDTTLQVTDTTGYASSGVLLAGQDFITYYGKTGTSFTGVSGVNTNIGTEVTIRNTYSLSTLASDMDEEQMRPVNISGQPYDFMDPTEYLNTHIGTVNRFSIFNGRLILPLNMVTQNASFMYYKKFIPMVQDADKPVLLPNNFRWELLGTYAIGNALMDDDQRTGWDRYFNPDPRRPGRGSGLFFDNLAAFKARYSRRVEPNRKTGRSVYDLI